MVEKTHKKGKSSSLSPLVFVILAVALAVFIIRDPLRFWHILVVGAGFGAIIFVHEFGHFFAAKSVGIFVEAFAIGFGPVFIGVKRVTDGFGVTILPSFFHDEEGKSTLAFVIPWSGAQLGQTDYQIRLIPLGGFVKMLGQEDTGGDKPSDDPRSFGNKAVWQRTIVISAGVFMNIVCAVIIYLVVFSHGIELPPAVVGSVVPGKPAALAGIAGGDEIIAINGKEKIDFTDLMIASAFTDEGEKISLTVRHPDGSEEIFQVASIPPKTEKEKSLGIKTLGIAPANELFIGKLKGQIALDFAAMDIYPGDKIVAVNNNAVTRYDQFQNQLYPYPGVISPEIITVTFEHTDEDGQKSQKHLDAIMSLGSFRSQGDGSPQVLTMIPRLKVSGLVEDSPAQNAGVEKDDVILRFGSIANPTYKELSNYCKAHENKAVEMIVARKEDDTLVEKTFEVTPQKPKGRSLWRELFSTSTPIIGVGLVYDLDSPIVVQCMDIDKQTTALPIPRGARITAIEENPISNWSDIIGQLAQRKNQQVTITYTAGADQPSKTITITTMVPDDTSWIDFVYMPSFGTDDFTYGTLPLKQLRKLYKGDTPADSLMLGFNKTQSFIAQTYLFLGGMFKGTVSPKAASGPVGILKMSYTVASQRSTIEFLYFLAMINVCIAVFNFLPLPVLDGGIFVLLMIEKIKGSPVPFKIQEIITYAGMILLLGFVLFVTYQDIAKLITGQI